ncbi:MAG: MgtC/SapB family protein [Clostridia bacterium]|nr:MgtC/SapB family protein [Clostridia bacterium]
MDIIIWLREFNIWTSLIRLTLAFILAGIVGFEREKKGHAAGLRTHILVCMGAALTTLTGIFCAETLGFGTDPMRIGAQVVSGIGFIGAGTIMVTRGTHVRGLTTAAGLWSTAAIGLALGAGFYEGAVVCTLFISIVISRLKGLDRILNKRKKYMDVYIEICGTTNVNPVLDKLNELGIGISETDITASKSGKVENVGVSFELYSKEKHRLTEREVTELVRGIEHIELVLI